MFTSITHIRVRYGETDKMGFLYHGNYALYYEVGRVEAIRELGVSYADMEEQGVLMPVVEMNLKYYRPIFYDNLITVKTILKEWPSASRIQFHTELYNEEGKLLNVGVTTLAFVDAATKRKTDFPEVLRERLAPYFSS